MIGCVVPFAERGGAILVPTQDLRDAGGFARPLTIVAGEPGSELGNAAGMYGVMGSPREQSGTRRRAERCRVETVVTQSVVGEALQGRGVDRTSECSRLTKTHIV